MEEALSRQRMTQPRRNGEERMQQKSQNWVTYTEKCNAVCRWELCEPLAIYMYDVCVHVSDATRQICRESQLSLSQLEFWGGHA